MLFTIVGLFAAALTSLSYIPQVKKALPAGSTDDLSLKNPRGISYRPRSVDLVWHFQNGLCDHNRQCSRCFPGRYADWF